VDLVISGVGVLCFAGEGTDALRTLQRPLGEPALEAVEEGLEVPVGRVGRLRNHAFSARYNRFGQIDSFSRSAFVACGHALDDANVHAPDARYEGDGVVFGTAFGCQDANLQFDQFSLDPAVGLRGASPLAFKGTVDNAPAGWVSVAYHLRGVNATFVSGMGAGAEAVLASASAIEQRRADRVIAGGVERLTGLQVAALYRAGMPPLPFASEGAAVLVIERAEAAVQRGHRPRARLAAAARLPGFDGARLRGFLDRAGIPGDGVGAVHLATGPAFDRDAGHRIVRDAGVTADVQVDSDHSGQMFATQAPLSLCLAADAIARRGPRAVPALLVASGEAGEGFAFLLGPVDHA